jgi:endonuclease/exonuclease/phosphatase family metal-dependent hydrolase
MPIPFPRPAPPLSIRAASEIRALDRHFDLREVPTPTRDRLLLASWNIANLGIQRRTAGAKKVIAHILQRFDLIAVQEVNDDYRQFIEIVRLMGPAYNFVMSDTAGNDERLTFIYNRHKVRPGNLFGEIALRPREYPRRNVKVHYRRNRKDRVQTFRNVRFTPFDRNPFIGSFSCGQVDLVLANVHLYFGAFQNSSSEKKRRKYARRVLEIVALARWANNRSSGSNAWDKDIVLIGDMNVPNMNDNEATIDALQEFSWTAIDLYEESGLAQTESLTRIGGSNLGNDKTYDQIAFAPTALRHRVVSHGVFDFDAAVFASKWRFLSQGNTHAGTVKQFNRYLRHYISDHRPVWVEIDTS